MSELAGNDERYCDCWAGFEDHRHQAGRRWARTPPKYLALQTKQSEEKEEVVKLPRIYKGPSKAHPVE